MPHDATERARTLRRASTPAERALWSLLRSRKLHDLKFRRQFPIDGHFVADFCCPGLRLIIELDGGVHGDPAQAAHDRNRDAYLTSRGYAVLRLPNATILDDPERALAIIEEAARRRGWTAAALTP